MIKDVDGKFDDYSISPKIRQILLHWSYELTEGDLLLFIYCSEIFSHFFQMKYHYSCIHQYSQFFY